MLYNNWKNLLLKGDVDLLNDTIKCALFTSSYTPNIDTNTYFSDISANEVVGTGYTTGGKTLSNKTVTTNATSDYAVFDADDADWTTSTITARYAVIYKSTGDNATSPLLAYIDFGSSVSSNAENFTVSFGTGGIFQIA